METLTTQTNLKTTINISNPSEFADKISETTTLIWDFANNNDYVMNDTFKECGLPITTISDYLNNLSKNSRKKIRNAMLSFRKKPTFKKANLFLHTFFKNILPDSTRGRIMKSRRQIEIETSRAAYVKLRDETQRAYVAYKTTKGEFYKYRLSAGMKIE